MDQMDTMQVDLVKTLCDAVRLVRQIRQVHLPFFNGSDQVLMLPARKSEVVVASVLVAQGLQVWDQVTGEVVGGSD